MQVQLWIGGQLLDIAHSLVKMSLLGRVKDKVWYSAKPEFGAMGQGIYELLWLKIIPKDLMINWDEPMRLYCDKKSTINIAHNLVQHSSNILSRKA